ncbi:MAG: CAP domain-containing protein [Ruminococcaceae bacterium]|nr:CAP domain-containing protein [Oscillospiraceae bacterium]
MTELLKVLKFICKRGLFKLRLIRYKGLYAFLGGVMVFAVCFGGKGESIMPKAYLAAESVMLSHIAIAEQPIPLSNVPYPVDGGEWRENLASGSDNNNKEISENAIAPFSEKSTAVNAFGGYRSASETENEVSADALALSEEEIGLADIPEETGAAENTAEETNAVSSTAEAEENSDKWKETSANGIRYVNTDGIYSRAEAVEGSEKVKRYRLNEKVSVTAQTDTGYFKLDNGAFIHSDYLSDKETPKWTETEASGLMYVCTDGIYSRAEAVEGAEKIERYGLNEKVNVTAKTDTDYYKLDNGAFIHSDYLSDKETSKWTETEASGMMYVCRGGIYSREEAVEGSTKIKQYGLNDTVNVVSETNTGYYKLDTGEFIHSDYLSLTETVEYPLSGQYGQRAQSDREIELARQVVDIVNEIRAENGLKPFKTLDGLTAAAAERAWETTFYNSHNRPDGTRCFTVLDKYGLSDPSAKAENIAMWSSSPQAVVNAWMNDSAHRKNILGNFEYIGVGCYYIDGDYYKYYWTQMFYTP